MRRRALILGLGLGAAGLAVALPFLPPVRHRIEEEWYLRKLDSPNRIERRRAGERLARLGSLRAIPRLVKLFPTDDSSREPPYWVPQALVRMGKPGIDAAFGLKMPDGRLHPSVFEAIEELGGDAIEVIPALVSCLSSKDDGLNAAFVLKRLGSQAIPPLLRALAEPSAEGRENAAYALGLMEAGAAQAVPALARALGDQEARVREEVAEALGKIGPTAGSAVPALALALKDPEREVREAAAEALGKVGPAAREAIPALVQALDPEKGADFKAAQALAEIDPEGSAVAELLLKNLPELPRRGPEWRWSFFWALSKSAGRSPAVERALLELTRDGEPALRKQAAQALSEVKTGDARRRLLDLLHEGEQEVRFAAALSLARQEVFPDGAIPVFVEALNAREGIDRGNAACYLKGFGLRVGPAVPLLIACLKDRDSYVHHWAQETLVAAKDAIGEHLSDLAALLADPRPEVRQRVAEVVAKIGPQGASAVPEMVKALGSSDDETGKILIDAIGAIGPAAKDAVPALISNLKSAGWNCSGSLQGHAILALGKIGEVAAPALLAAMRNPTPGVREGAALALGQIPAVAQTAVPELLRALGDPEPSVRSGAAESLGAIAKGTAGAIPALKPLLRDPESMVRLHGCKALQSLGAEPGLFLPTLIALLDDSSQGSRSWAAYAIGDLGPAAGPAVPSLVRILKDEDRGVVQAAATALGNIGKPARAALPALQEVLDSLPGSPIAPSVQSAIEAIRE
jgi:HEAT repeat protein